ncbi:secreted RxLR effector protein 78-like [Lotus japonicus]|uniref:secreted RxLR effector protein 78-like n=1 Tax=Lotus japonicus TaxID=34305 RepID=UPI0025835867|nr:secreted RxLR effector protein 78-like [Lotus japonicus]
MLDSVLIVNEIVDEAKKKKKKPTIIFKVDYEKAYDSVRWDFLFYMLRRMNFNDRWIRGCLESNSVSVLVNGSPSPEFKMWKGLRQGDPLAPFLFLIVAEGLNGLLKKAVQLNKFAGFRLGMHSDLEVSMLQFADDTLFIGNATQQNVQTLKCVLRCFEMASGLKVNFSKSKLIGVAVED